MPKTTETESEKAETETVMDSAKSDLSEGNSDQPAERLADNSESYKTLSRAAIFSVLFGILSLSGFLFVPGMVFALIALGLGIMGWIAIRKYPHELTGSGLTKIGIAFSLFSFIAASGLHTYIYLTEVPEDHERLTFYEIKAPKYDKYTPTTRARDLDGKKVFIKGYTFPGKAKKNLSQFLLVGDFGSCCFGGDPEPTHLVKVSLKGNRKIDYSQRLRKLSGTFRVRPELAANEEGKPYIYELVCDDVK